MQGEATCVTSSGTCKLTLLNKKYKRPIQDFEKALKKENIIEEEEFVTHIMEEASFNNTINEIEEVVDFNHLHDQHMIPVNSINMYAIINEYHRSILMEEADINTKYKMVDRKIKPIVVPLPKDNWQKMKEVANDQAYGIQHEEERMFCGMLERHRKVFVFSPQDIGCADPKIIEPIVIFTVPHVPCNLKPIPVPFRS